MSIILKTDSSQVDRKSSDYLAQLLSDKKQLQFYPNVFLHVEKLVDEGVLTVAIEQLNLNYVLFILLNEDPSVLNPGGMPENHRRPQEITRGRRRERMAHQNCAQCR